ncbi:MAG: Ada metal-binding domain-containing protein [Candidatus Xenobiia bacterium LiM19]
MKRLTLCITFLFIASAVMLLVAGCNESSSTPSNVPVAQSMNFIGDNSTKTYHMPTCKKCPHEADVVPLDSPLSATRSGFKPCKKCHPPTN